MWFIIRAHLIGFFESLKLGDPPKARTEQEARGGQRDEGERGGQVYQLWAWSPNFGLSKNPIELPPWSPNSRQKEQNQLILFHEGGGGGGQKSKYFVDVIHGSSPLRLARTAP